MRLPSFQPVLRLIALAFPAVAGLASEPATDQAAPRIVAVGIVPAGPGLRQAVDDPTKAVPAATPLGGLSDLCVAVVADSGSRPTGDRLELWTVTDRGPNGLVETAAGKRRTLIEPDFVPSLVRLVVEGATAGADLPADAGPRRLEVGVAEILPLASSSGRLFSGRANGIGGDPELRDPTGTAVIAPDPHGVDTEGVVQLPDGTFWLAEEYRPSLLRVAADGRCSERLTPVGDLIPGSEPVIRDTLPARLAGRQDNRGLEAVAAAADGSAVFALLQSPLDREENPGQRGGNVPLVMVAAETGRLVAEFSYPLDEDTIDGKLSALAVVDAETLLVLEHCKSGRTCLYAATLAGDGHSQAGPLAKRPVADLTPLLARMGRDVYGRPDDGRDLKLEGLAIIAPDRIVILNDNDFGVPDAGREPPQSCLWFIELPGPLTGRP